MIARRSILRSLIGALVAFIVPWKKSDRVVPFGAAIQSAGETSYTYRGKITYENEKMYAYFRTYTYDVKGNVTAISAQTKLLITES